MKIVEGFDPREKLQDGKIVIVHNRKIRFTGGDLYPSDDLYPAEDLYPSDTKNPNNN